MINKKLTEEIIARQEQVKERLDTLEGYYGVKMTVIAKAVGIHYQNLHNFRKGKRTISEEKLSLLEELLEFKYGKLFEEEL
ncbi:hypothetical protein ACOYX0_00935 [Enterococcus thailandicus]|uniref:hypothetical protein n=1 Tax=Enterococcus TaxID=1350 RepID=UPI001144C0E1|nr:MULTISPECIES: hypothetical protein [Enterococcus]MCU2001683.1 hypothetical protein [Enterococcus faecium]EIA6788674.1 hypothetical protein [Enterococcus faecalis]EKN1390392.1 hypothetical protein [Enterococcus faecalis]MBP4077286.1 hypothetical protein [Enterococcus faecalis]MBP4095402.1 hypothetical protein [Enterococcus faecalis]